MFAMYILIIAVILGYGQCKTVPGSDGLGIVGGHEISIEKVPYITSIRRDGNEYLCGGSIIHEQFILTAAHGIESNRKYKVLVGTDKVDEGGKLYDVEKILIHEMYSNKTDDYDICILKLNETLSFGAKVNKIVLNDGKLKCGMMFNTAGWGFTQSNGTFSQSLRAVKIPMVPQESCQCSYEKIVVITPRMICAGGRGKDSCMGDSGGPLTWNNTQIGITSVGSSCGNLPGIYTKVSVMLPWIKQTIEQNL